MINLYLENDIISNLIEDIYRLKMFNEKKHKNSIATNIDVLYLLYFSMYKFKIVVDDDYYLNYYCENIDKIFRKVNDLDDIDLGVNKIIALIFQSKFNLKNISDVDNKKKILENVYNKYIVDGYLFHGTNSLYVDNILNNGLYIDNYPNYYSNFNYIEQLFEYRNMRLIDKDFTKKHIHFTDDFIEAIKYSNLAPKFYSDLKKGKSYNKFIKGLKNKMYDNNFTDSEIKYIIEVCDGQEDVINKNKDIAIVLVKRSKFVRNYNENIFKIYDNCDKYSIEESMSMIFNSIYDDVIYNKDIKKEDVNIIKINKYDSEVEEKVKYNLELVNEYGSTSYILIVGILLVSMGVLIMILIA